LVGGSAHTTSQHPGEDREAVAITTSSHHQFSVTANTLNRQLMIDRPNRVWARDISYIWTTKVNRDGGTRDEHHWQSQ
jgi:transposase InsO family protein